MPDEAKGSLPLNDADRRRAEQAFHDRQARERAGAPSEKTDPLPFDDDRYLDHESWIRPAFAQLGDLAGSRVLDFGCGHGMAAVVLARRGAQVTAFDVSTGYLCEAGARAQANGVSISFASGDGVRLPFADGAFDRIWGNAVLHHVDLRSTAPELARVLAPGGVAVFCEPWGENPLLTWARQRLPYPGKERTPTELPLRQQDLTLLRANFASVEVRGFQLLSMVRRVLDRNRLLAVLEWCDDWFLRRVPRLQRLCRYVVLTMRPRGP